MNANWRARATIARRLCTVAGFYRCAAEEELLEHSPAAHVRRPRLDYESHVVGLDCNELGGELETDARSWLTEDFAAAVAARYPDGSTERRPARVPCRSSHGERA